MNKIFHALKFNGLFLVDFTHFPAHNTPFKIPVYTIDVGQGLRILKTTYVLTKEDLDTRWDDIQYELNGEDITGQEITWNGKSIYLKPKLSRTPLLRIPREKMEQMLKLAGFDILEVRSDFAGCPESMLYIAQKTD